MRPGKFFLQFLFLLLIACGNGHGKKAKPTAGPVQRNSQGAPAPARKVDARSLSSFVLSCGSGCAMTYTPKLVTGTFPRLKVQFEVEMFIDEKPSDIDTEVYEFSYDSSDRIVDIRLQGGEDNVLKTLTPAGQRSFRAFAEDMVNESGTRNRAQEQASGSGRVPVRKNGFLVQEVWRWVSADRSQEFSLKVQQLTNDSLIAQYCAVYNGGQKLDCDFEFNPNVRAVFDPAENAYKGIFKSFFDSGYGLCRVERNGETLIWKIVEIPAGEYYAPQACILTRVQK